MASRAGKGDAAEMLNGLVESEAEQVEIQVHYAGYIGRQQEQAQRFRESEDVVLPETLNYEEVHGLSHEAKEKLMSAMPVSVGQAARIPGITPAAIGSILVHLRVMARGLKSVG